MVAKKLVLLSLLFMTFVLHSNENYCFSYSEEKVSTDKISKLLDLRSKALKHCLVCDTESCSLKDLHAVNKTNDLLCKSLFCRPIKKKVKSDSVDLDLPSFEQKQWFCLLCSLRQGTLRLPLRPFP